MINFQKYEKAAAQLSQAANALWSKVTFVTISDIISNDVDARELDKLCWDLKDKTSNGMRMLSKEVDSLPEDDYFDKYEDDHIRTEDLFYKIDKKLDAIEAIVDALREIQNKNEDDNFNSQFEDIPRINIDESFSFIRLNRFKR
jgi:hypothetical protein